MRKISWLDPTLRQADTVQVMVQVHQGKLSPEAAEEWAKANGRPPFVPAIGSAPNPMEKADWPFTLAAAWILTREPIQALKASMEYEFWGRVLCRDSRKQQAQTDLWHQLRSGRAHATGVKAGSEERVAIRAVEWNDLTWMRFGTGDIISFRGGRSAVYQDVRIEARDIYRLRPVRKPSEVKAAATAAAETRCRQALVELMRADPGNPIPKETLKLKFPGVGGRGFERVFAEAAEEAPAPAWRAKGRRKKAAPVNATPK